MWPNFGHFLVTFWTSVQIMDFYLVTFWTSVQNLDTYLVTIWTSFQILDIYLVTFWTSVQILDTSRTHFGKVSKFWSQFWTVVQILATFWARFGHILDTFVQNVSILTLFRSTGGCTNTGSGIMGRMGCIGQCGPFRPSHAISCATSTIATLYTVWLLWLISMWGREDGDCQAFLWAASSSFGERHAAVPNLVMKDASHYFWNAARLGKKWVKTVLFRGEEGRKIVSSEFVTISQGICRFLSRCRLGLTCATTVTRLGSFCCLVTDCIYYVRWMKG